MDYEKKYKEAMGMAEEIIRYYKEHNRGDETSIEDLEQIFPELKESEDERIRKALIKGVESCKASGWTNFGNNVDIDVVLAWLEKQKSVGEIVSRCKTSWYNEGKIQGQIEGLSDEEKYQQGWHDAIEKISEQKSILDFKASNWYVSKVDGKIHDMTYNPTDRVEPKFKVGDWVVTDKGDTIQISAVNHGYYTIDNGMYFRMSYVDKYWRLWTIQDAKKGDVLVNGSNIFIFHFINDTRLMGYCHINIDDKRFYNDIGKNECFCLIDAVVNPATKEQRDTLKKAMADAGWEFDFEKKELKKLTQSVTKTSEQDAWSYEDEANLNNIIWLCNNCINGSETTWIPSQATKIKHLIETIKKRGLLQQKSAEWSDEDERMCQETIDWFEKKCFPYALEEENPARESIKWLKSLKDRLS